MDSSEKIEHVKNAKFDQMSGIGSRDLRICDGNLISKVFYSDLKTTINFTT